MFVQDVLRMYWGLWWEVCLEMCLGGVQKQTMGIPMLPMLMWWTTDCPTIAAMHQSSAAVSEHDTLRGTGHDDVHLAEFAGTSVFRWWWL